jgi:hypothetical protein
MYKSNIVRAGEISGSEQQPQQQPNPFDPASLRLDQSFTEGAAVKKQLTTAPVRKPHKQDFVRVHPDPNWRLTPAAVLEVKEDREYYLVMPHMVEELREEIVPVTLFTTITRQGTLFLWPCRLPSDGKRNDWHRSALEGAELAMTQWIRVMANMDLGAYEFLVALSEMSDPKWPDVTFPEVLRIAFRDNVIGSLDHQAVKRLRGQC